MLDIADSRFQPTLRQEAQRAGKLEESTGGSTPNTPERLSAALGAARRDGTLPAFPLGTEMTETEQSLAFALSGLKSAGYLDMLRTMLAGLAPAAAAEHTAALERMTLAQPTSLRDRAMRALVLGALRAH
jgi:hypothetical protein